MVCLSVDGSGRDGMVKVSNGMAVTARIGGARHSMSWRGEDGPGSSGEARIGTVGVGRVRQQWPGKVSLGEGCAARIGSAEKAR